MKEQIADAQRRMQGAVAAFQGELAGVRTGRATTALLDRVNVDAYGTSTPLKQLATVNVPEPRLITVQPYDQSIFGAVEKALLESDIGLNPTNDGQLIRLAVPELTEERRKELTRLVHKMAEEARVAVRNVRRDVNNEIKRAEKDREISKNELARYQDDVQKLTDAEVQAIDELMERKEAEILEV